jgi:hypothetical protein
MAKPRMTLMPSCSTGDAGAISVWLMGAKLHVLATQAAPQVR